MKKVILVLALATLIFTACKKEDPALKSWVGTFVVGKPVMAGNELISEPCTLRITSIRGVDAVIASPKGENKIYMKGFPGFPGIVEGMVSEDSVTIIEFHNTNPLGASGYLQNNLLMISAGRGNDTNLVHYEFEAKKISDKYNY